MSRVYSGYRPRPVWLTAALYVLLLAVMVGDGWALTFWTSVGGSVGLVLTAAAGVVVLLLAVLLLTDARRQWVRHRLASDPRW
jgi:polyferredoxin